MPQRRRAIAIIAAALVLAAWLAPSAPAQAEQGFQRFIPLLIDLPGWTGNKPDGLAMEIPGNSMVTATREYDRGEARLNAQIVAGPAAQGALAAANSGMKIETSEGRMSTSNIDGFQVTKTFTISDKSGAILVALSSNAMFMLSFTAVDEAEALSLASKFNWKSMQGAVGK